MSVVCEEVFDETSNPSIEEINDYAKKIGIDPDSEPQLLPLAAEGLMKALPPGWRPCYDEASNSYYYHNNATGKTQWEHPLDEVYRGLVKKARTDSQSLSLGEPTEDATYIRDELPSFEEPIVTIAKKDIKLSPLKKAPDGFLKLIKQKSEERPLLNIDKELKVTGGGSIFLKSNTKKLNEEKQKGTFLSPETPPPRSILRSGILEPSRSMEFDRSADKSDKEEDDKKSVRFNLDKNTTDLGGMVFSDKSSSCSDEEESDENKQEEEQPKETPAVITKTKSRFTVSPVRDDAITNLKLIKPNPADFIKPKLKVSKSSDSDEDSLMKILRGKKLRPKTTNDIEEEILEKTERKIEQLRNSIWEEKNDELRKFREDIQESHQKELERILIEEKSKHEENIKKELENLRIEMENRTKGTLNEVKQQLEAIVEEKKQSLEEEYKKISENLQEEFDLKKKSLERLHNEKIQQLEKDFNEKFEKQKDDLIVTHNATVDQLKHNHSVIIEDLKKQFKTQEEMLRKERQTYAKDDKNIPGEERQYEKIRCEKRLLEDKYRCLKEKYLKLKTDVKLSIEKRNRRREQSGTATTTGSETERSHSINKERSPTHVASPHKPPTPKHSKKPEHRATRQIIIQDLDTSASDRSYKNEANLEDSSDGNANNTNKNRKKMFSRLKSSSTSRINKSRKTLRSCSPVENLRRQLQKLEDLEDQFPQNSQSDTYHLRYPFSDEKKFEGSSELEFFRHRIHLERDSIKRAKESLRSQKSLFQQRQKELKLKHGTMARHTLQQLCQEEKELTDMEVSLHRTRSLLGEKVIRLRHLEQSLYRATLSTDQNKQDDATLSDLSSHSASSGISSTEFATADGVSKAVIRGENFQESSEIIQSLENFNSEIREIWEVLHKQQQQSGNVAVMPPLPLVYPDLGWPVLAGTAAVPAPPSIPTLADRLHNYRQHVALANAQSTVVTHANQGATTTLVERTRNLRHWLRQAGIDNANEGTTAQATL